MSYLVLARKYRPQIFSDVIGQEHVTRTLQNAIVRGRVHHAFLFCGGRGTGKTTTARILAKALSCDKAPTPNPCNECPACVEITQGTSVDVQEIDAASQNRVEDIRDLRENIRYAPVRGKKKLYILDEVHMLSTSAFNALLKTLEEPPEHALFVFATTDPHKLPQTILSRVQRYDFKLLPTAKLLEHLGRVLQAENISFEAAALKLIAREGQGSVRDAMSLLDQVLASMDGTLTEAHASSVLGVADRGLLVGLGRAIVEGQPDRALSWVETAYTRGLDLSQLCKTLLGHFRDLLVVAHVKDPLPLLEATPSELEELRDQASKAQGKTELLFHRMLRIAEETSRAALPRYVLEVGAVEMCGIEPMQPIEELVDRLEQMEMRLACKPASPVAGGREPRPFPVSAERPAAQSAPLATPVSAHAASETQVAVAQHAAQPATQQAVQPAAQHVEPPGLSEPSGESCTLDFHTLMGRLLADDPTLSVLSQARNLGFSATALNLGFATQFALATAEKKRKELERVLQSVLGHERSLVLELDSRPRPADPAAWSVEETQTQQHKDEQAAWLHEAENHPARRLLLQAFAGVSFLPPSLSAKLPST